MHPKYVFDKNYIYQLILLFNLFLLLFMDFSTLIRSILTHFYFTMDVISEAKSEPSRSLNSEAMSEPSWSMMVETRARAILGNGTSFFFFLVDNQEKELFLIDNTNTDSDTIFGLSLCIWYLYLSNNFFISNTFIHIFIYFFIHIYFKKLQK